MRSLLLLLALAPLALAAEGTVVLKTGARITGDIENEKGPVVSVSTPKGTVRVPLNLIARIERPKERRAPRTAAPTTAPVVSRTALEEHYAKIAALEGDERTRSILELAATVPIEEQAEFLAFASPDTPEALVALDAFAERRVEARAAGVARLRAQNECSRGLFLGLVRVWDAGIESALIERLAQDCRDHAANLEALAARGTRRSVAAIVDVLFFSPEKDGLTFPAQHALREIAQRDPSPDEALEPLIAHVEPGWPGPDQLVRRRDVILAMGASSGGAVPWLAKTLSLLPADDLDPRASCWRSLARIGSREAVSVLLKAFEGKLDRERVTALADALAEGRATRPELLLGVASAAERLAPDLRSRLLAGLERATGQRFSDVEAVRKLAQSLKD